MLDAIPTKHRVQALTLLCAMPYAENRVACEELRAQFVKRYRQLAPKAVERLAGDWERLVTFYQFPREHRRHLRTTNMVESPFVRFPRGPGLTGPPFLSLKRSITRRYCRKALAS